MSDPSIEYADKRYGAICEIISAISALNMHPEPLPEPEDEYVQPDAWQPLPPPPVRP